MIPRPFCAKRPCAARAASASIYCGQHKAEHTHAKDREYKAASPERRALYNSKAWRIVRVMVLARDPICRICGQQPSTDVDHVTPLADGGAPLDMANLQGACHEDHSRKTREEIERRKHV